MGDLTWCRGTLESAFGEVAVEWHIDYTKGNNAKCFTLDVAIPDGGSAVVVLPYSGHKHTLAAGRYTLTDDSPRQ